MAYQCPRCGKDVQRGSHTMAGAMGGLVGAMLYAAFGSFHCKDCGPIVKSEFPPETRQKMQLGSVTLIVVAVIVLVGVLCLLAYLQR